MLGLGAWRLVMQDEVVAKLEGWLRAQVETHRSLSQLELFESRAHNPARGLIAPPLHVTVIHSRRFHASFSEL